MRTNQELVARLEQLIHDRRLDAGSVIVVREAIAALSAPAPLAGARKMTITYHCACGASWTGVDVPNTCPQCLHEAIGAVCEHGEALDVHCCHCHSGFIFEKDHECHPRRCRIDRISPAEHAIYAAIEAVEHVGADVRLTDAVVLLQAARESVADFIDGIESRRTLVDSLEPARWQPIATAPRPA